MAEGRQTKRERRRARRAARASRPAIPEAQRILDELVAGDADLVVGTDGKVRRRGTTEVDPTIALREGRLVLYRSAYQAINDAEDPHRLAYGAEPLDVREWRLVVLGKLQELLDGMPRIRRRVLIAHARGASYRQLSAALRIGMEEIMGMVHHARAEVVVFLRAFDVLDG